MKQLKLLKIKDVLITTVTYHGRTIDRSNDIYLSNIKNFLKEHGFRVYLRIDCGIPDKDFIFMSNADVFIQSGGGYSRLVAKMVKMNGGTVLFNNKFYSSMLRKKWIKIGKYNLRQLQ